MDADSAAPFSQPGPPQTPVSSIRCYKCGYSLHGVAIGAACPECGTQVDVSYNPTNALPTSGFAIASLVLGILSILGMCGYGIPGVVFGIIGLVLASKGKADIVAGRATPGSAAMVTAGRVCSLIGLIVGGLFAIVVLGFIILMMMAGMNQAPPVPIPQPTGPTPISP